MKKHFLLAALAIFATGLQAQKIQISNVREQNSKKRPVPNAQVIFSDAVPATSDQSGNLRLVFQEKNAGDWVFLTEVQMAGYELVNNKEIEQVKLSGNDLLGVDIILAKLGMVDAAKKDYYGISDKALLSGFEKEKRRLRGELGAAKLSQQQYEQQFKQVQEQYDRQREALDALSERFARVNFDDVDSLYREALELFKAGEIEQCKKKLENANLIGRTNLRLQERERIVGAEQEISRQKADNERGIRQDIESLRLQAQTYLLTYELGKAENLFDQLLLLDSTDLSILCNAADFYRENNRYEKALRTLSLIISHPSVDDWQKANAHIHMGMVYTAIGQLERVMQAYTTSQKIYANMLETYPISVFYKYNLAASYSKLGEASTSMGNLVNALTYYEKLHQLSKEIYESIPQVADFKSALAISYNRLGIVYTSLGIVDTALIFLQQGNKLDKELYESYPHNNEFKNALVVSYSKLGEVYNDLDNLQQALLYFEESSRLAAELNSNYPQNIEFIRNLAASYDALNEINFKLGNMEKAFTYAENYNSLVNELYILYPQNVGFKNGLAISYERMGIMYAKFENLEKALTMFELYSELEKELFEAFPENVDFKNGLAISYERLGSIYVSLSKWDKARFFFEQYNQVEKELCASHPESIEYKDRLAVSYARLGVTCMSLSKFEVALHYFEQYHQLEKELFASYPEHIKFKNDFAISCFYLGAFNLEQLKDNIQAKTYFQQAEKLWAELMRDTHQAAEFQQPLGIVQNILKNLGK